MATDCRTAFFISLHMCWQVARAFRKLQRAALRDHEWERASAAFNTTYHTFKDVPPEAFPLFLSSRTYLRMLDGTTERPFFPRAANGSIIQVGAGIHCCQERTGNVRQRHHCRLAG